MTAVLVFLASSAVFAGSVLAAPRVVPQISMRPRRVKTAEVSLLRRLRLPLASLAGGAGWAFVGGVVGIGAGAIAAVLAWRTLTKARSPQEIRNDLRLRADYPLVVELLAHVLAAGSDVGSALAVVARAVGDPWESRLAACLNALSVGQPPDEVWAALELDPLAFGLGRVLSRSHRTGVPVSRAMRALAQDVREEANLAAHAYARTIEVRAAVPLGVCFLPAFVLLGVVPLVVGILRGLSWVEG